MKGIVEVKCANCNKKIYVQKECIRPKMFCTVGCMDTYTEKPLNDRKIN